MVQQCQCCASLLTPQGGHLLRTTHSPTHSRYELAHISACRCTSIMTT